MKRISICTMLAALLLGGCAKTTESGEYDNEVRYLTAWLKIEHPELEEAHGIKISRDPESGLPPKTGRGVYLLSETEGTGEKLAEKGNYVRVSYIAMSLDGSISSYTEKETAEKLGKYEAPNFYGPHLISIAGGANYAGVIDAVAGMKVGGERTVLVPKWLMSTQDNDSEEAYLSSSSSASNTIYKIRLVEIIEDVNKYQVDAIEKYLRENVVGKLTTDKGPATMPDTTATIGACKGFYFIPVTDTTGHRTFPTDTTVKINYTGRRLDEQAFDTTIERTAKDNDIWSSSKTYATQSVSWGEKFSDLKMGSSSLISGFSKTLWQMNKGKGIGIFWSDLGYGSSGSGSMIPGYAPLIFEIEIVSGEEKK